MSRRKSQQRQKSNAIRQQYDEQIAKRGPHAEKISYLFERDGKYLAFVDKPPPGRI